MKKCMAILSLLMLGACQTTYVAKDKPIVVMPDKIMFECPSTVVIPPIETLTDIQVAQIILELKTDLEVCINKMKNLETFLTEAKKRLEK